MAKDLDDILDGDDDLASFFKEDENDEDDLAFLFANDEDEDDLASFFENEEEDDDLASFFDDNEGEEDDLASFFEDEPETTNSEDDLDLASFFENEEEDDEEDDGTGLFGEILGALSSKPDPILPYKKEKRKAKLDITKNSKEDHRDIKRYTKSELQEQLKRDYKYMLGKPYMVIQPVTILADYPYKKKKSNSDAINDHNVEYDYVLVIGKLLKWRSTEEFRGKAYKLGEIMYMKRGVYWVNGKQVRMEPHFAIVLHRSYKRIKSKRIRDLLAPLKQRLRAGKPFSIYKEFPIIVERTGVFS